MENESKIRQCIGIDYYLENSVVVIFYCDIEKKTLFQKENHKNFKTFFETVDFIKLKIDLKRNPLIVINSFDDLLYQKLDNFFNKRDIYGKYIERNVEIERI